MKSKEKKNGKLFVLVAGVVAATIIVLNLIQIITISTQTKGAIKKSSLVEYENFAEAYSTIVSTTLEKYFAHLDFYTNADIVKTGDNDAIINWLRKNEPNREKTIDYVAWVDNKGGFYSDLGTSTNVSERDYFQAIMRQGKDTFIDNPVTSKVTGKTVIHICKAAKVNGRTVGFFCGVLDFKGMAILLENVHLDKGDVSLFSSNGDLICTSGNFDTLKSNLEKGGEEVVSMLNKLADETSRGNNGIMETAGGSKINIYHPIEHTQWFLTIMMDEAEMIETATTVMRYMVIGGIALIVIIIALVVLVVYNSLKPLQNVENIIMGIASGEADLTKRIDYHANNEIGRVVKGFNLFSEKLQTIVREIKFSKDGLVQSGESLDLCTQDTTAAIDQILNNINSTTQQINNQTNSVSETAGAVNQIASNIESLNNMIENQTSAVTEASAAVEEMIGNISSVNNSVSKMAMEFEGLGQKVMAGVHKQEDVNDRIQVIESESKALQEANMVISSIAEQTNLLAMNAAIEAAHAGEAGKGFSVVADEIRKLSETSSSQSKTIGEQLKNITESIDGMVEASMDARQSFTEVSDSLTSTTNLVREIKNAMLEQGEGSKQISIALNSMNDSSNQVKNASREMAEGNKQILEAVRTLQDASGTMRHGVEEMSSGAEKINSTGKALADISGDMDVLIRKMGAQVDQFKV
ncbi:MAG: HAMP domain-containing protein [Treponema sp.]|nr:HAMP domain-containing protein [Treponema sp.]